jgi:c-di-GMP-binding flagellar brake protein YcgR
MPRQPGSAERRRHTRVSAPIPCRLLSDGKEQAFDLVDLSESGVRIRCPHALPPMTRLGVSMILPGKKIGASSDLRFDTTGVVVWSHKQGGAGQAMAYDVGLFFSELDDRQRNLLRAFVGSSA